MSYIKVSDTGNVYPYSMDILKQDNPQTSIPDVMPDERLIEEFGVYPVQEVAPPTPPDERTTYTEGVPELVNGVWRQTWVAQTVTLNAWRATLSCSNYQFRRALRGRGLRDQLETWAATAPEAHVDYIRYSRTIWRGHPAIEAIRVALGATHAQVDNVFVDARDIQ